MCSVPLTSYHDFCHYFTHQRLTHVTPISPLVYSKAANQPLSVMFTKHIVARAPVCAAHPSSKQLQSHRFFP